MKMKKVPVQKGKIIANPTSMKQMPYPERVAERKKQLKETRRGQSTELDTPRKGRK
jgi:hypothetical protein